MTEKAIPNEDVLIEKILQRRHRNLQRIPSEQMKAFKEKLGEEIERTGKLDQSYVDRLMEQLKNGEL